MNIKDWKCKAEEKTILVCDGCDEKLYQCVGCEGYFLKGVFVGCPPSGGHLCKDCFEERFILKKDGD